MTHFRRHDYFGDNLVQIAISALPGAQMRLPDQRQVEAIRFSILPEGRDGVAGGNPLIVNSSPRSCRLGTSADVYAVDGRRVDPEPGAGLRLPRRLQDKRPLFGTGRAPLKSKRS